MQGDVSGLLGIPQYLLSGLVQFVLSVVIPLGVAYFGARAQITKQRRKEQQAKEINWFQRTASLCQIIEWSFTYTDNEYDVSNRLDGIPLNELGSDDDLAYLDEQMLSLLNHSSTAPKSIEDETIEMAKEIVFEYTHPRGTLGSDTLTFGEMVDSLEDSVRELREMAEEEEMKRTPEKSYLTRVCHRILRN